MHLKRAQLLICAVFGLQMGMNRPLFHAGLLHSNQQFRARQINSPTTLLQ